MLMKKLDPKVYKSRPRVCVLSKRKRSTRPVGLSFFTMKVGL